MYDRTGHFEAEPNHQTFGNLPNRSAEGSAEPLFIKNQQKNRNMQLLLPIEFLVTFSILIELSIVSKIFHKNYFLKRKIYLFLKIELILAYFGNF